MPVKPQLTNVQLPHCCQKTLDYIGKIKTLGEVLKPLLVFNAFLGIFSNPPQQAISVFTEDWDALAKAVMSVPPIVKSECHKVAFLHQIDHAGDHKLSLFWGGIVDSFDGGGR